jgi:hypothetical protein
MGQLEQLAREGKVVPYVDPTAEQQRGRSYLTDYATRGLPGMIDQAQASWQQGLNMGLNPYIPAMIQAAQNDLVQDWERNILPGLSSSATMAGGYGGGRHQVAEGIAAEGLAEALGDVSTNLLYQGYDRSLSHQRDMLQLANQMVNLGLLPGDVLERVGGLNRADLVAKEGNQAANILATSPMIEMGLTRSGGVGIQAPPDPYAAALEGMGYGGGIWDNIYTPGEKTQPTPAPTPTPTPPSRTPGSFGY